MSISSGPLRLTRKTTYTYATPAPTIAPEVVRAQWCASMRRFLALTELLARERRLRGMLPSYRDYAPNLSKRQAARYIHLLAMGGVVVIRPHLGAHWNVSREARYLLVETLPYPIDQLPPRFDFARV